MAGSPEDVETVMDALEALDELAMYEADLPEGRRDFFISSLGSLQQAIYSLNEQLVNERQRSKDITIHRDSILGEHAKLQEKLKHGPVNDAGMILVSLEYLEELIEAAGR